MPKADNDDGTVEVPAVEESDDGAAADEGRDLSNLDATELAMMQAVVDHFLPEGRTFDDALDNVARFGRGDNVRYKFVAPDDWDMSDDSADGSDDSADGSDDSADGDAVDDLPAAVRRKVIRHPATVKQAGPVRKRPEELTADDRRAIWKAGLEAKEEVAY